LKNGDKIGNFSLMRHFRANTSFRFAGITEDVQRLKTLIRSALHLISWAPPLSPSLLNIACGRADETGVLLESFASHSLSGIYVGLDLRDAEIAEAKKRWGHLSSIDFPIEFRVADASSIHSGPRKITFDLIFIRHQNYWDAPAVWERIFQQALAQLNPQGILIFTSYFDRENELAVAALRTRGARCLLEIPHTQSRELPDTKGKSVDRMMAIFVNPSFADTHPAILVNHT
jgi:hypothetical protein